MEFKKAISYKKIFAGIAIVAVRESLSKQRKSGEKVENSMTYHLLFTNSNTVYARNRTVYAKRVF
mgnify:FL=1